MLDLGGRLSLEAIGTFLTAKATVLCARPMLPVQPRLAVGVSTPIELELPMLPRENGVCFLVQVKRR